MQCIARGLTCNYTHLILAFSEKTLFFVSAPKEDHEQSE